VWPFQTSICALELSGQQMLDGLEWGARSVPDEHGGFFQVSGLTYEIDASIPSGCTVGGNGMMTGIEGARRVRNVTVGGEPIDPDGLYSVAGTDYTLLGNGDGFTYFDGARVLVENAGLDSQVLIDYITDTLGGVIGSEYADPYGQGRIVIVEEAP
jgi:2',3'-cyclic-nucleotide 2'-phosphodiesterase (5'-nucleotidase family)